MQIYVLKTQINELKKEIKNKLCFKNINVYAFTTLNT